MAKPFDATLKHLIEAYPADWLALLGLEEVASVEVIDADLATVTAEADRVFRVVPEEAQEPSLLHMELQSSYDPRLPRRLLRYNVLLDGRHDLPVRSVAVLLRPEADGPRMTGLVSRRVPRLEAHLTFRYGVVRVWQLPVDTILQAGPGTLPLAPLGDVEPASLPGVIRQVDQRIREVTPSEAASLWTATYVLMGLRYPPGLTQGLLRGVRNMKESATYQAIVEEGRAEGRAEAAGRLREVLLVIGGKRFGDPGEDVYATVRSIEDLDELTRLSEHVLDVESWEELLALR